MRQIVQIWNRANADWADAELYDTVDLADLEETRLYWRPVIEQVSYQFGVLGQPRPQSSHWNWTNKARLLKRIDSKFIGIRCADKLQGLMKVDLSASHRCRESGSEGKELIYIDYLETAPWNLRSNMAVLGLDAVYSQVGTRLVQAAARLSVQSGFDGRVGLHSLPQAEPFYLGIGMTAHGIDYRKERLRWFEFTSDIALDFMESR